MTPPADRATVTTVGWSRCWPARGLRLRSSGGRVAGFAAPLLAVATVLVVTLVVGAARLPAHPGFVLVMITLVGGCDVLSAVLLLGRFRDSGEPRLLVLAAAYASSLVILLGWAAAFPGVFAAVGPLGSVPSTAPWLWVTWHTAFPVMLAAALMPWPAAAPSHVPWAHRRQSAWISVGVALLVGAAVVAAVEGLSGGLPVIIHGTDSSEMTRLAGPVMLPIVAAAVLLTLAGARRRSGPERWAGLAAAASFADVVLTLSSHYRYSVGWYAGRTMTMLSAGVVLVALIAAFRSMGRQMAEDDRQLRKLLADTGRLERLQNTLLGHIGEGVLMQDSDGRVLTSNPAARAMLDLSADQLHGRTPYDPRSGLVDADGSAWQDAERRFQRTVRTGQGRHSEILGVRTGQGALRWLSVNTTPVHDPTGRVEYIVSSMRDVTDRHTATLTAKQEARDRHDRLWDVLESGGPAMVLQPIVELATGRLAGAEALARFPAGPEQGPDVWFTDAAAVGLGVELEVAAVRRALARLEDLPPTAYLSLNASPATAISPELQELLTGAPVDRLVLELTEHAQVEDYELLGVALARLRRAGMRIAVDDAGAGYASLRHILNLAPDIIKLDSALVSDVDTDPARLSLAAALKMFADQIGADIVAEGIETESQLSALERLGIRYGQGYHLGRPATHLPGHLAEDRAVLATARSHRDTRPAGVEAASTP